MSYITISQDDIVETITKPDVIIIYLNNGKHWLCDKNFKPIYKKGGRIKYKLATK